MKRKAQEVEAVLEPGNVVAVETKTFAGTPLAGPASNAGFRTAKYSVVKDQ